MWKDDYNAQAAPVGLIYSFLSCSHTFGMNQISSKHVVFLIGGCYHQSKGVLHPFMPVNKLVTGFLIMFFPLLLSGIMAGCAKDYSFEGRARDTVAVPVPVGPAATSCALCNNTVLPDSSWRFTIDGVAYCGKAEKAIITLERTSFTFFGPSACTSDSGFVASVYIDNSALDMDKTNVTARLSCFYYDQLTPSYVFMSSAGQPLQLTIASYSRQSGIAKGSFSGSIVLDNGIRKEIKNGQFQVRL